MSHKKNRKFKKIREKLWAGASGSILAGMMLVGANTAFAENVSDYTPKQYEQVYEKTSHWNTMPKINTLINQLGLDNEKVKRELKSGKTLKQILQDHDIAIDEVQKAFDSKRDSFA